MFDCYERDKPAHCDARVAKFLLLEPGWLHSLRYRMTNRHVPSALCERAARFVGWEVVHSPPLKWLKVVKVLV